MSKTWFITGASAGLGRLMTERLLVRGDRAAASVQEDQDPSYPPPQPHLGAPPLICVELSLSHQGSNPICSAQSMAP
jgi:NAD(P)-dependent dehydrogenase (short-subunit alcohol dehydrogenase family)